MFDGSTVVLCLVGGPDWIDDLEVDHRVDRDDEVVLGDDALGRERHHLLAHVEGVSDLVEERNHQMRSRIEYLAELAEPFDYGHLLLTDDFQGRGQQHDHDDDKSNEKDGGYRQCRSLRFRVSGRWGRRSR